MAMNGTGIGTSTTGNPRSPAAARKAPVSGGTNRLLGQGQAGHPGVVEPLEVGPLRPAALRAAPIPVVMIISAPKSHGVGSSSSLTCAQATRRDVPASPAISRSCSAGDRSRSSTRITPCAAWRSA